MAARLPVLRAFGSLLVFLLAAITTVGTAGPVQGQDPARQNITVTGRDHAFSPTRVVVGSGDIVRITLVAEDVACSFAIDAYRISKRATPGHPVTFEFRADRVGTFPFYCDLTTDDACRAMRGELIVESR